MDHIALTYYQKTPDPVGQQARYLDRVAEFDFDLQYRPGSRHANCDALSRRRPCEIDNGEPCKQCNRRVTAQHVRAVQIRAQQRAEATELEWHDQIGEAGPEVTSPKSECKQTDGQQAERRASRHTGKRRAGMLQCTAPTVADRPVEQWSAVYLAEQQRGDPDIGPALKWVTDNSRPDWGTVRSASQALRALWQHY